VCAQELAEFLPARKPQDQQYLRQVIADGEMGNAEFAADVLVRKAADGA